jgi:biopolymer transport protein ExbD
MQFKTRTTGRKPLINITSLIDVLFLLLIFLMVSSTFIEQPGIKLDLPEAQSAAVFEQKEYILYIDKEGKLFLNDAETSMPDLEGKIKAALPKMKDSTLILKADQSTTHGVVVKAMDVIKKSGVKKLVIGTKFD